MTASASNRHGELPGGGLSTTKMPGHWLLARFGKRVLRPGGRELTGRLLQMIGIGAEDDVVEFAPGLGVTAEQILARLPMSYRGIERDEAAAKIARAAIGANGTVSIGDAETTGLADGAASVVIGEAMLTMQPQAHKQAIVREAARLLRPGGRYGVHELAIVPDHAGEAVERDIASALSSSIHAGARPLTEAAWRDLFERAGLSDIRVEFAPMHLLEPRRLIADEGLGRAILIVARIALDGEARQRVLAMRNVFRRNARNLKAIAIVAAKRSGEGRPR